jgi:NAD(P)-dependent dehydrogenase (short-subunit alcohol dehydrogenase family)
MSQFDLADRVAIVTGSTRGIGRAAAEELVANGARVVISSRKAEACSEVAAAINATHGPGRAIAVPANISSREELGALVAETTVRFGRIDILVCNAATNPYYGPMAGIADEQFEKVLRNNILSNHWLIQMVAPGMAERGDGAIIIVSSIGGLQGSAVIGAYNISKAADMQLARNLAVELGGSGIRVNCVAPGVVRTDFAKALLADAEKERVVREATPLKRVGQPEDIAGAIAFLAAPASRFVTGQAIVIDGGMTISGPAA